jgi:hypothetical protein
MDGIKAGTRRASADLVVMVTLWALVAVLLAVIVIEPLFAATGTAS